MIEKSRLRRLRDVESFSYKLLYERFNDYVSTQNRILIDNDLSPQFGMLILDTEGEKKDLELRNKILFMLRSGTEYSNLEYVVEQPMFTDSKWRNLIQLSDCVAHCIRKKFKLPRPVESNLHTEHWDRYYEQILPKFHNINGTINGVGLKIFPQA